MIKIIIRIVLNFNNIKVQFEGRWKEMAEKEISNIIKLQIEAGKATPAPPVGPALGSSGVNIQW